jgi:DnaK suppressor protein
MALISRKAATMTDQPREAIRCMLAERRRELLHEIQTRVKDVRGDGSAYDHRSARADEAIDADTEDDLAFALIQMKVELLARVNEALRRFDEGTYGDCVDCGDVIAPARLRALPFAVRCRDCEDVRERSPRRTRIQLARVSSGLGTAPHRVTR